MTLFSLSFVFFIISLIYCLSVKNTYMPVSGVVRCVEEQPW